MPRRCAFGCMPSEVTMHRFPDAVKFPEQFKAWVSLVGGRLESLQDFEYYKTKRICDIHFSDSHRNRNNRLSALAIPMLHLPEQPQSQLTLEQASTSSQHLHSTLLEPDETGHFVNQPFILEQPSTSTYYQQHPKSQSVTAGTFQNSPSTHYVTLEHNYSAVSKPRRTARNDQTGPLRTKVKQLQKELCRLRKKGQSFKTRLRNAENVSRKTLFQNFAKDFNKATQLFLSMQLQNSKKKKGRRFTLEEKVLSLSLYKKSPKCYGLLNKFFTLPSTKAMKRLLSNIKICPGINHIIFQRIKKVIQGKDVTDRLCSLIFDEMSLTPQINYNAQKDLLEGFATNNDAKFADHALVFMVKGIKENFKQPIAYYFTAGLTKIELKNLIKEVVKYAQETGLIILNTVCDQSTVNVGAITEIINESKAKYFRRGMEWRHDQMIIHGHKIIPLFDVPHLIKGIRNNLISKDLVYISNGQEKVVKWEYYQNVYAADKLYGELRLLHKLTEEHINPEKINKMRVKSATQLFSHSVAAVTNHLTARGDLPQDCKQLVDLTLLLDNLFDSLNILSLHIPDGKIYKGPVKKHTPHHELWRKAKEILKTIKFRQYKILGDKSRLIETTIPSVSNLIKSIEGMEVIWNIVSQRYGFDALLTRNFNQDPVENFFGNIRSYGARNNCPSSIAFEGAYKALLLNNYNSPHSVRANCEEDSNQCLETLEFFFTDRSASESVSLDAPNEEIIQCNEELFNINRETDAGQRNYVCGWVLTKCLKNIVKTCRSCKQNLIGTQNNYKNSFIKAKEYANKKWLCYPSEDLENCFHDLQNITTAILKKNVPKKNIKKQIILLADTMVSYPFHCDIHKCKLKQYFINTTVNVIIYSWCRSINRILSGKVTYIGDDEIKNYAQQYYNKRKHYKNKK